MSLPRPQGRSNYKMPSRQKPDGTAPGSSKRLASRFYQLKTGHSLTRQYLQWTKNRRTAQCCWCRYRTQSRGYLFKVCPEWKAQQKILWAEVWKEPRRGRSGSTPGTALPTGGAARRY